MNNNVVFYEKPGCIGNQQQKALLRSLGIQLDVRDLLSESWTAEKLRPFFTDKPVSDWFNLSAPSVKSGDINIHELDEQQAIKLMQREPLLICRPLLKYQEKRQSGFISGPVLQTLDVPLDPQEDLQSCPMTDEIPNCGEPQ